MNTFENISDEQLDHVKGGLSFSLGFDTHTGISIDSSLGGITLPNPISFATDTIKGLTGQVGDLLTKFAGKLSDLGQLFDFS